jgi:hypothetical protein
MKSIHTSHRSGDTWRIPDTWTVHNWFMHSEFEISAGDSSPL